MAHIICDLPSSRRQTTRISFRSACYLSAPLRHLLPDLFLAQAGFPVTAATKEFVVRSGRAEWGYSPVARIP